MLPVEPARGSQNRQGREACRPAPLTAAPATQPVALPPTQPATRPAALAPGSGDHRPAFALLVDEAARSRCLVAGAGEAQDIRRESDGWIELGSVLADLDRIRRELSGAVGPTPVGDGLPPATAPRD